MLYSPVDADQDNQETEEGASDDHVVGLLRAGVEL